MKRLCLILALFFGFFELFAADKPMLAVMEIEDETGNFEEKNLSGATEYLRGQLISSDKFIVVAKNRQEREMIAIMKEESHNACYDEKCHIALGKALSADTILTTKINFVGGIYVITSALIDLETETAIKRAQKTFVGKNNALLPILRNLADQITGKKSSMKLKRDLYLSQSDFYGKYNEGNDGVMLSTFLTGASLMIIGFPTLAVGLWGEFRVAERYGCDVAYYCWEYDYISSYGQSTSYIDRHTSRAQAQAKADKSKKAHIISGAVLLGAGVPFFITGITYAVWDKYTKGERAAGFLISFGTLAAAGGGTMIGLNGGKDTMFYGGIATAAVGAGMLIGGITMAALDAQARQLKNYSFLVTPDKDGFYAQMGFDF